MCRPVRVSTVRDQPQLNFSLRNFLPFWICGTFNGQMPFLTPTAVLSGGPSLCLKRHTLQGNRGRIFCCLHSCPKPEVEGHTSSREGNTITKCRITFDC